MIELPREVRQQAIASVRDVQERLRLRVEEVDLEVHEDEFGYWKKFDKPGKRR